VDGRQFDALSRAFASKRSRRSALGVVLGAIVLAGSSSALAEPGNGQGKGHDKSRGAGHDKGKGQGHVQDDCNAANCPPDQSTVPTNPVKCCDGGFCSCGGECCGGPDCWILTTQSSSVDGLTVRELCTRPPNGCLQCENSGGQCCADCTADGDCVSPCIQCPGEPSAGVCCATCIDTATRCNQIPDTTPISGGIIRRR
jgi:hypothetical protein